MPGKFELTVELTRIMMPFLTLVALAAALMGMLNALGHFFIPALSPAMFNVGTIVCALALVPLAPALGIEPIMAIADRHPRGRPRSARVAVAAAQRAKGIATARTSTGAIRGCVDILVLMVPGTIGLAATQINVFVNTMLATGSRHRRRVVAQLRVPVDVPADRPVRRLDRDRGHAGDVASGARRGLPADAIDGRPRAAA